MPSRRDQLVRKPSFDSSNSIDVLKSRSWHQFDISNTFDLLGASEAGLTTEEARRRLSVYGPNTIDFKVRRTPFRILFGQFTDFMIVVLIAAAILSGIIGDIQDTIVIAAIVVLNGIIGFVQEYRAERAVQALQKMAAPSANVIRDHRITSLPAAEIVPGDILVLEAGAIVPADLRLIESVQLRTDEAALTG